ncbi:hypothetical protein TRFO_05009 [Tritrichomonas foetus]|uniref:Protein kinase domain-containing protein n=1 Tax=Tritrichomonas foetus TaxID=1144522 RepID=A0A1J4K8S8_9EUKA|nr:hypothetical protein TRFO_05009 [Tritrichomonas foetus]|eukprot:OHT07905.1 hypothetical protein TRFO_05009 [Tritrichomonas foetus]
MKVTFHKMIEIKKYFDLDEMNPIGEGGFGVVFRGHRKIGMKNHSSTIDDVVVKYLKDKNSKDGDTNDHQRFFYRELSTQSSLDHMAVLPILNYQIMCEDDPRIGFVMPFMKNGSLRNVLKLESSGMKPEEWNETKRAICIFGIAAGMAFCHQNDIIHRDLKTDNILLDENMYPKISDFGLAKIVDENVKKECNQTLGVGTMYYMAPEVMDGEGDYNFKADVFSYSMILYEIISCEIPYSKEKFNLFKFLNNDKRPPLDKSLFPPYFYELIQRCWDRDPNFRPSFKDIIKEMYENVDSIFTREFFNDLNLNELMDYMDDVISGIDL